MFCGNCGNQIPDGETVCPYCNGGQAQNQPQPAQTYDGTVQTQPPMDYAAVSLVLGIVGLLCSSCCMPILNIIGIVFGVKASKITGRKAGLILNIVGLVLSLIGWIILAIWWAAAGAALFDSLSYMMW